MYKLTIKGARPQQVRNVSHHWFEKSTVRVTVKDDVTTISYRGDNEKSVQAVVKRLLAKTGQNVEVQNV
jgi:hypothetical protein